MIPTLPLESADLESHGIRPEPIQHLSALIDRQMADGRYPGCQIALARRGRLLLVRTLGDARLEPEKVKAADDSLWLLYSNTKVILATALWKLAEEGAFRFADTMSAHLPEFARHGKKDVTVLQVITHQGGFPNAEFTPAAWKDVATNLGVVHPVLREAVCNFALEWTPGSKVSYHPLTAHWALAALIEQLTARDFRDYVRDAILAPLGLERHLMVGLPPSEDARVTDMHEPAPDGGTRLLADSNTRTWRRAGAPGGGGYGTAQGMAALYQMILNGGELNGVRVLSPRTIAYALRNYTGDRVDEYMGMPMHRGLGPHLRGHTLSIRGLGTFAPHDAFGHGGVGSSYCWADPSSGVSFAYLTNSRQPDPWHSDRLDTVANLVHTAILPD